VNLPPKSVHVWFQNRRQRHQTKAPAAGAADAAAAADAAPAPEPGSPVPGSPAPAKPAGATVFSWSEGQPGVRVHELKKVQG